MKKILMTLMILLLLVACSSPKEQEHSKVENNELYMIELEGKDLALNQEFDRDSFTKADDVYQGASCGFDGYDHIFTYDEEFVIYTYPIKEVDYVSEIQLLEKGEIKSGIKIGSSEADVEKVYGSEFDESGAYRVYKDGNSSIEIMIVDGIVEELSLVFIAD